MEFQAPNVVGCPLGALQLVVYCKYRNRVMEEPKEEWDVEKLDQEDIKQHLQIAVVTTDDKINEKMSQNMNSWSIRLSIDHDS